MQAHFGACKKRHQLDAHTYHGPWYGIPYCTHTLPLLVYTVAFRRETRRPPDYPRSPPAGAFLIDGVFEPIHLASARALRARLNLPEVAPPMARDGDGEIYDEL